MKTIFIVEDDDNIRDMVAYALTSAGFEAAGFVDSKSFLTELNATIPSLVLLDIMLPGEDGITILKKIRQLEKTQNLPVIMLTAKGSEYDRIKGLDLGADDYITKPFSVLEVISRVRAVLRRTDNEPAKKTSLKISNVVLHEDKREVYVGKEEIKLTYKEFELLHYLMLNGGIVLSRDKLLSQVWGFDYTGESRTVDMHIKSLRHKLGASGELIKTVRNVGYKIGG